MANIVNTLGNNPACPTTKEVYWNDTAIFVTWDDWGGRYDHINPNLGPGVWTGNAPWGNWYTYGFRVPLLVVWAYTGVPDGKGGYKGYVSGACGLNTGYNCPNFGLNNVYVHDFGSILGFVEWNFGVGQIYPKTKYYADYNAPDWGSDHKTVPLSDFFDVPLNQPRTFDPVTTIRSGHDYTFFQKYYGATGTSPEAPDDY